MDAMQQHVDDVHQGLDSFWIDNIEWINRHAEQWVPADDVAGGRRFAVKQPRSWNAPAPQLAVICSTSRYPSQWLRLLLMLFP